VLCGADWSALRAEVLIVNPGQVFPAIVTALATGRRLGVIKPSPAQVAGVARQFGERGIEAVGAAASPYIGEARLEAARRAAERLRAVKVDLVWMTCVGMDEPMRAVVREVTGRPVILARSLLSRVVDEFLVAPAVPPLA
jgi:protein AroM